MFRQINTKLFISLLVLIAVFLSSPLTTLAQSETAYDLVNAVNGLRTSQGLEPYQIDPWMMDYAQEHAEYQAAIQTGTHEHSDGSLSQSIGLEENVAYGDVGIVTVAVVVYEIWIDWIHSHVLTGYATGEIGAGMALAKNGQMYFTVNIRPGEEIIAVATTSGTSVSATALETSIPNQDGSITHTVGYGQTLWDIAIAYGVTVDDIRQLNRIQGNSTVIQVGQNLLIFPANTIIPTVDILTPTPVSASVTATETIQPTPSPSFTLTPISTPSAESVENTNSGTTTIVLAIGAFVLLLIAGLVFREVRADKLLDGEK